MYKWLFFIGLILLVILASGSTESVYAWNGHGGGHGGGGHGYLGHGWGGHGSWGHGYRGYGYGWRGPGFFFSLVPPLPILPVPVPVPGPPVAPEPYPDMNPDTEGY